MLNESVRPSGNIPKQVRELTGITNEMVENADTIDQVLPRVAGFIEDARIVAHNAHFDRRFLERNARLMGVTFAENEWVCTMSMAKRVPLDGPYGLAAVAEELDVPVQGSGAYIEYCAIVEREPDIEVPTPEVPTDKLRHVDRCVRH